MDKQLYLLLTLLCSNLVCCKEDCQWLQTYTFEAKSDVEYSFSAEIKNSDGLVIDITYEDRENYRIELSPKESKIYKSKEKKYITMDIDSFLHEGLQNISLYVGTSTLDVICTSSDMVPVHFSHYSRIKSIKISAVKLKICEESCNMETSIEKLIENGDTFKITAFTNDNYPITFNISYPGENGVTGVFEIKPKDCVLKWNQLTTSVPCGYINPGWNRLNILVNRTTLAINGNTILQRNVTLKIIRVSGSYLTNCTKGSPTWNISNQDEFRIPIITGQEIGFLLTSNAVFSPVLDLEGNRLTLNWINGLKFGSSGKPLQANSYYIILETASNVIKIYNAKKYKQPLLIELMVYDETKFISFGSIKGKYLLTLMYSIEDTCQQTLEYRAAAGKTLMKPPPSHSFSDCIVRAIYKKEHWSGEEVTFFTYVSENDVVNIMITYKYLRETDYFTTFYFPPSTKHNKRVETKAGEDLHTFTLKPMKKSNQWVEFRISSEMGTIEVFYEPNTYEQISINQTSHTFKDLTIRASNLSLCKDERVWEVAEGKHQTVPLQGNARFKSFPLTFYSSQLFEPVIQISEYRRHLLSDQYNLMVEKSKTTLKPLNMKDRGRDIMEIHKSISTIDISSAFGTFMVGVNFGTKPLPSPDTKANPVVNEESSSTCINSILLYTSSILLLLIIGFAIMIMIVIKLDVKGSRIKLTQFINQE